jgi:hypothetical protein
MDKRIQHVVPNSSGGWAVLRSGASRASRIFKQRDDALTYARRLARKQGSALYVQRRDGTVRERDTYRSDGKLPRE